MYSCRDCLNWAACDDEDKGVSICEAYEKRQLLTSADVEIEGTNSTITDIKE